jgi:hypothetical protein
MGKAPVNAGFRFCAFRIVNLQAQRSANSRAVVMFSIAAREFPPSVFPTYLPAHLYRNFKDIHLRHF